MKCKVALHQVSLFINIFLTNKSLPPTSLKKKCKKRCIYLLECCLGSFVTFLWIMGLFDNAHLLLKQNATSYTDLGQFFFI